MGYFKTISIVLLFNLCNTIAQPIAIRPAALHELPLILELDKNVTDEFFKPLFIDVYKHLNINRNADEYLQAELAADADDFPDIIKNPEGLRRLLIAWNLEENLPCGLIVFHKEETEVILDLLLVDKQCRGKGIGKQLVYSILTAFPDIKAITVHPVQHNNLNTLKFYESLGFKNLGCGPADKLNSQGIRYSDMYYHFRLDVC